VIAVPGYIVVAIMVAHAVLAYLTTQTEVKLEPVWNVAIGAVLIGLNVLQSVTKSITEAVRTMTRRS